MATTMEALRTKLDGLQWEVNRLDVENRRLRDANEDASRLVDLEAELGQAKQDVDALVGTQIRNQRLRESVRARRS